jgi:hypothetical protein
VFEINCEDVDGLEVEKETYRLPYVTMNPRSTLKCNQLHRMQCSRDILVSVSIRTVLNDSLLSYKMNEFEVSKASSI